MRIAPPQMALEVPCDRSSTRFADPTMLRTEPCPSCAPSVTKSMTIVSGPANLPPGTPGLFPQQRICICLVALAHFSHVAAVWSTSLHIPLGSTCALTLARAVFTYNQPPSLFLSYFNCCVFERVRKCCCHNCILYCRFSLLTASQLPTTLELFGILSLCSS
jgi:hypothetical protein